MQCKYEYLPEDVAVKKKKRQVGERCPSMLATEGLGGYCSGHAKKMGMIPEEVLRDREARQREKLRKTWEEKKAQGEHQLGQNKPWAKARDMIDALQPEIFDLKAEYRVYKGLNMNPTEEKWDEKVCFSRWLASPEDKRKPKSIEAVADVFDLHVNTLHKWKRNRAIVSLVTEENNLRYQVEGDRLARAAVFAGMERKDMKAVDIYFKYLRPDREPSALQSGPPVPQELLDFAKEAVAGSKEQLRGAAKEANDTALINSQLSGDIEQ